MRDIGLIGVDWAAACRNFNCDAQITQIIDQKCHVTCDPLSSFLRPGQAGPRRAEPRWPKEGQASAPKLPRIPENSLEFFLILGLPQVPILPMTTLKEAMITMTIT